MISQAKDKKKLKFDAVWLWCVGKGYEQKENKLNFLDAIFSKNGETTGFIFEFDKTVNEMLSHIEKAKEKVQYIYIVTDDDAKYRSLKKTVPEFCGIFCNSNAFGLGMVTQIMRKAKDLKQEGHMKNYADTENKCDLKDYDDFCVDTKYVDGEKVEYKIIFGNNNIVFIKAGAGGNVRGYKDKYLQMAKRIHDRIGATVICASNPDAPHVNFDEQEIRWVALEQGFETFNLFLWGTSDGSYQNLSLAKRFPETVKWIGVNSSFITFADFEEKLQDLIGVKKILVYGTEDDEYDAIFPALMAKEDESQKTLFVEGADHCFSDMLPQFIQTIDLVYEEEMDMEEDVYKGAPGLDPELEYEGIEELLEDKN